VDKRERQVAHLQFGDWVAGGAGHTRVELRLAVDVSFELRSVTFDV
jgi:hypothetical protein